jgi:hypothetical protein
VLVSTGVAAFFGVTMAREHPGGSATSKPPSGPPTAADFDDDPEGHLCPRHPRHDGAHHHADYRRPRCDTDDQPTYNDDDLTHDDHDLARRHLGRDLGPIAVIIALRQRQGGKVDLGRIPLRAESAL